MNGLVYLSIAICLAAPPPLTQTQQIMLEDVAESGQTADEAGLYALLTNARLWDADPQENMVGATVPDFPAIRDAPAEHRGNLFLIEGSLETQLDMGLLSREGFEDVVTLTLRVQRGGVVLIYLTQDPQLKIAKEVQRHAIPQRQGANVKLAARFYKFIQQPNSQGQMMLYPVFVGRSIVLQDAPGAAPRSSPGSVGVVIPVAVVILMLAGFSILRKYANNQPSKLDQRRAQREAQLQQTQEVEYRDDLPEDPADALGTLEQETEDTAQDGNR